MGNRKTVYMILMDFLRAIVFKVKLSARKPLPTHVAEVSYMSEDQAQLEEEEINFELELMNEARNLFKKLNIPNYRRNRDILWKPRSTNPFSESEIGNESSISQAIQQEDDERNHTPKPRHEKNYFDDLPLNKFKPRNQPED